MLLLWWRRRLPESPRWLEARGRVHEAGEVLKSIEQEVLAGKSFPANPPHALETRHAETPARPVRNVLALFTKELVATTLVCWLVWLTVTFAYYGFFTWLPTLLVRNGIDIARSFGYSVAIFAAQVPGYYSAAQLNEVIGRRATIVVYLLGACASAAVLSKVRGDIAIVSAGACLSLFMNGTYAGLYAYTSEVFPTMIRATGAGMSSAVGRLGAVSAPMVIALLYRRYGFAGVFGVITTSLLIGAVVLAVWGVGTKSLALEDIHKGPM